MQRRCTKPEAVQQKQSYRTEGDPSDTLLRAVGFSFRFLRPSRACVLYTTAKKKKVPSLALPIPLFQPHPFGVKSRGFSLFKRWG